MIRFHRLIAYKLNSGNIDISKNRKVLAIPDNKSKEY